MCLIFPACNAGEDSQLVNYYCYELVIEQLKTIESVRNFANEAYAVQRSDNNVFSVDAISFNIQNCERFSPHWIMIPLNSLPQNTLLLSDHGNKDSIVAFLETECLVGSSYFSSIENWEPKENRIPPKLTDAESPLLMYLMWIPNTSILDCSVYFNLGSNHAYGIVDWKKMPYMGTSLHVLFFFDGERKNILARYSSDVNSG